MFSVVPLTLTISLCLVFTFVVFFLREHSRRRFGSSESDALLPLSEETPSAAAASGSARPPRASSRNEEPVRRVVLDLGGRLPKQRRRPCGRHGDGGGGNCDDCEHKHEHHDHHHADGECARRQERRETDAP
ncbi:hypothetical protein OH491_20175 [Termitidicoccus mucosus]|uniref:Uncharacterized protein n=1 Tax=Termitidicoccus mucosus TaxID=1184151 RepID=A0A178IK87_9BACT|nr:hypothetical protein AW736_08550 [Opitutaceae bacterium TSB47]